MPQRKKHDAGGVGLKNISIGVQGATAVFGRAMQHRWLCHPPCLPSGRLRRLPRHRRRLAAENSEGPLGAPTGGLARPQGESRLTPAEPENAASAPVGTPSGVVSPLYTDTCVDFARARAYHGENGLSYK